MLLGVFTATAIRLFLSAQREYRLTEHSRKKKYCSKMRNEEPPLFSVILNALESRDSESRKQHNISPPNHQTNSVTDRTAIYQPLR